MNLTRRQFLTASILALPAVKLASRLLMMDSPVAQPIAIEAAVVEAPVEGAFEAEARYMTSAAIVAILKELYDKHECMKDLVYSSGPLLGAIIPEGEMVCIGS